MRAVQPFIGLFLILLFSSCTGLTDQEISAMKEPSAPYKRTTEYSQALDKFSAMLAAYDVPDQELLLLGKTVTNKTACANLPLDITQMVATAVNRLGGRIGYIPYNPTYLELEARLNLPVGRDIPMLVIDGAITECDENLDSTELGVDANAVGTHNGQEGESSGGYQRSSNVSRIALDFHLMSYQTSILLPRIQSSIAVDIRTLRGGYDFALQILGSGFGIDRTRKITQGKHEAIRSLVNLSILQLLGQYLQVPYWRCLPGATPDRLVVRALEEQFSAASTQNSMTTIQLLLQKYGYTAVRQTGVMDDATRNAITAISLQSNGAAPAMVSPALYSYLYINMPFDASLPASIVLATPVQETASDPSPAAPDQQPVQKQKTVQLALNLQTAVIYRAGRQGETVLISGGRLRSGNYYKIMVEPEQDCYLYIFQRDSGGRLFTLFPGMSSQGNTGNPVKGNKVYEFPGNNNYFVLDKQQGNEQIIYYSTAKPDALIENNIALLNGELPESRKREVEKKLLTYLSSKDASFEFIPGDGIMIQGQQGKQPVVRMNKVQKLSRDKLYIFPFQHQ